MQRQQPMNDSPATASWPADWPVWVRQSLDDLERIEMAPSDRLLHGAPGWVQQMLAAQMKLMFPSVPFTAQGCQNGPQFLGAFAGHLQDLLKGDHGIEWSLTKVGDGLAELDKHFRARMSAKAYLTRRTQAGKMTPDFERFAEELETVIERKTQALESIMRLAASQPIAEQQPFFSAYGEALGKPAYDDNGQLRYAKVPSTPAIYFLMTIAWRPIVTHMGNTSVLHRWLCRLLGPQQVGDLERVKKICARYKVRLAGRGRPRKKGH